MRASPPIVATSTERFRTPESKYYNFHTSLGSCSLNRASSSCMRAPKLRNLITFEVPLGRPSVPDAHSPADSSLYVAGSLPTGLPDARQRRVYRRDCCHYYYNNSFPGLGVRCECTFRPAVPDRHRKSTDAPRRHRNVGISDLLHCKHDSFHIRIYLDTQTQRALELVRLAWADIRNRMADRRCRGDGRPIRRLAASVRAKRETRRT